MSVSAQSQPSRGSSRRAKRTNRLRRWNANLLFSIAILGSIIILAVAARHLTPYDPVSQQLNERLMPPVGIPGGSWQHPLGTDGFGRDVLARTLYGSRISLEVGTGAVLLSGLIGTTLGLLAGYTRGWVDSLIMRLSDAQQALPPILLAIIIVAVFGTKLVNLILILTISSWVIYARVVFASTVGLREREFIEAARAIGAGTVRILARHVLPNLWGQIMVISTLQAGRMILLETSLSFLGLGVPAPAPSWGSSLADARTYLLVSPWPATIPGLAIVITVWSVNILGEGLRGIYESHG